MPDFALKPAALFDRQIQFFMAGLGRKHDDACARAQASSCWKARLAAETIVDCARSLIASAA